MHSLKKENYYTYAQRIIYFYSFYAVKYPPGEYANPEKTLVRKDLGFIPDFVGLLFLRWVILTGDLINLSFVDPDNFPHLNEMHFLVDKLIDIRQEILYIVERYRPEYAKGIPGTPSESCLALVDVIVIDCDFRDL